LKRKLVLFVAMFNILLPQSIKSPINSKYTELPGDNYSILIAGHLYGAPQNVNSVFPSSSLLGCLEEINNLDCAFFISAGDVFRSSDERIVLNYMKSFSNRLNFPIFNAVGNHDVGNRKLYTKYFGETYYDFIYGSELYVFLDSELDNSKIIGKQLEYFSTVLLEKALRTNVKNVIVVSHKLIWAANIPKYKNIYNHLNSNFGYETYDQFNSIIIPILKDIGKQKNVYWISGDIGCSWSLPLFYDKDPDTGISFIATGLGDTEKDLILKLDVMDSEISMSLLHLSDDSGGNIESFNLEFWEEYFDNTHILNKIRKILFHKYYLLGIVSVFPVLALLLFRRKKS